MDISPLGYALLCALHKGPLTGYDLVRRMHRPIAYYWSARQSQIYPELGRLTEAGLIESEGRSGPGPHPTRTHRLTPAGRSALAVWLPLDAAERHERDYLMLKTYAVKAAKSGAMADLYRREAEKHEARAEDYRQQRGTLLDIGADVPGHRDFGAYATLELGVRREEHYAEWCQWMAQKLAAPGRSTGRG